jgi:hypothetical protein
MTWVDTLKDLAGLADQPMPETPEFEQMERELCFAIANEGDSITDAHRAVLKFMIGRGYWPLGTRMTVTDEFKTEVTLPTKNGCAN